MTLDKLFWLVGQFVNIDKYSEESCLLLNFAQNQYYKANVDDEGIIWPFIKTLGIDSGTMPLSISAIGSAIRPLDFQRHIDATIIYEGKQEQIERVENWEFHHRLGQAIEVPTRKYPICTYYGTTIKFAPKNLQYCNLTYLSTPPEAVYAYKPENGLLVYDPDNSVELLWTEHDQVEVIRILLQELGVIITSEEINNKSKQQA